MRFLLAVLMLLNCPEFVGLNRKLLKYLVFIPAIFLLACEHTEYIDSMEYIRETEPNEATFQALEIVEGSAYAGEIAKPKGKTSDTDLYKIWLPSGTLITLEFESREEKFEPYVGHTDNLGNYSYAIFEPLGKHRSTFVTTADGWQYFEIGDKRNTGDGKKFGGFKYYFRVVSKHICDADDYEKIELNSDVARTFSQNGVHVDILDIKLEKNDLYQFDIESKNMLSDKFSFIMNCGSREIAAGNDDEDYYGNKLDPLIYTRLEKNLRYLFVTGGIVLDLSEKQVEKFTVSMKRQPKSKELEPNDTYNYANVTDSPIVSGYLDKEKKNIVGETGDDEDWFRFDVEKGDILSIRIEPENPQPFIAEMWASSYGVTGSGLIALRASMLSGNEDHVMNMFSPFNGQIYLDLIGSDIPYKLEIKRDNTLKSLNSGEGDLEIELPDCGWKFYKWNFSEDSDFAEITLSVPGNFAGLYIFDKDYMPYANPEFLESTKFFIRKYEKTESLVLGLYIGECEQNSGQKLNLSVTETVNPPEKWNHGTDKNPVKISAGKGYQGYFDTDSDFYENFFEFTADRDGTAYILTFPDRASTAFDIDTVVTLLQNGEIADSSDDMMQTIHFNKYSFVSHEVRKGETYTVKVTPFMSESSNISAMNIKGSYILDLYLK